MLSQKARVIIYHILGVFLTLICCNPSAGARNYNDSIVLKGTERTYRVHLPPSLKRVDKPPLLIVPHGGGGSGKQMERMTLGKFNTLADREGFIVVYPDALGRHWKDGRGCFRLACELSERVAVVAAVAGMMSSRPLPQRGRGGLLHDRRGRATPGPVACSTFLNGSLARQIETRKQSR